MNEELIKELIKAIENLTVAMNKMPVSVLVEHVYCKYREPGAGGGYSNGGGGGPGLETYPSHR